MLPIFHRKIKSSKKELPTEKVSITDDDSEFSLDWWATNRSTFPRELQSLTDQFVSSDDFYLTSKYWLHLMKKNYLMLLEGGVDQFAKIISRNYFTWTEFSQA